MEQKNRFLSLGIALGLIAGTAAGVLVDLFTGWTFSISMGAGPEIPLKKVRLFSAHILVLSIE